MKPYEEPPLSPLDEEIEMLLGRLKKLEARKPTPSEAPIVAVAIEAIRRRLNRLSRKCTDRTCRIRVIDDVRRAIRRPDEEPDPITGE